VTGADLRLSFWVGAAAALVAAALIAILAVFDGEFSDTDAQILGTLGALLLAGGAFVSGLALVDRDRSLLGRIAAVLAPVGLALLLYAIWDAFDEGGDEWRYGWTGALLLVVLLVSVTAQLMARSPGIRPFASGAGVLATVAAALSLYAIWNEESEGLSEIIVALWILTVLLYLLVPVFQRTRAATMTDADVRVLATLGDVELIATAAGGLDPKLVPGERLVLRRRA
jgi:hypothetical protein